MLLASTTAGSQASASAEIVEGAAYRAAYRKLLLRWHTDKFAAQFGRCSTTGAGSAGSEVPREVMERVLHISQCVTQQWSELSSKYKRS